MRAILIQGDSVRMTWGLDDLPNKECKPLRRGGEPRPAPSPATEDALSLRLGEELDFVRRMLDALGDELSSDPILMRRHAVALQSLDKVGQILGHVRNVIRSSEPLSAVAEIGMSDLRARLSRDGTL
jgi:hypothetical protein